MNKKLKRLAKLLSEKPLKEEADRLFLLSVEASLTYSEANFPSNYVFGSAERVKAANKAVDNIWEKLFSSYSNERNQSCILKNAALDADDVWQDIENQGTSEVDQPGPTTPLWFKVSGNKVDCNLDILWSPDQSNWMPVSMTLVSGGKWDGQSPAAANVYILGKLAKKLEASNQECKDKAAQSAAAEEEYEAISWSEERAGKWRSDSDLNEEPSSPIEPSIKEDFLPGQPEAKTHSGVDDLDSPSDSTDSAEGFRLKKGSKGKDVRRLQKALVRAGFSLPRYGVDGDYGRETRAAVISFKKKATSDGRYSGKIDQVVNLQTLELIESYSNSKKKSID